MRHAAGLRSLLLPLEAAAVAAGRAGVTAGIGGNPTAAAALAGAPWQQAAAGGRATGAGGPTCSPLSDQLRRAASQAAAAARQESAPLIAAEGRRPAPARHAVGRFGRVARAPASVRPEPWAALVNAPAAERRGEPDRRTAAAAVQQPQRAATRAPKSHRRSELRAAARAVLAAVQAEEGQEGEKRQQLVQAGEQQAGDQQAGQQQGRKQQRQQQEGQAAREQQGERQQDAKQQQSEQEEETEEEAEEQDAVAQARAALPPARILQDDQHPIREADISRPAWFVLSRLRAAGHEAYLVGGTIRDLLLGGTPKDFDLLTSGEPHQIKKLFSRCNIVGRSFPVCQVYTEGTMIEVSSFSTNADARLIPADASSHMIGRQKPRKRRWEDDATWAAARADNAVRRDFTVNGLLYDPFSRLLFDAVGGLADCEARRLRTILPPAQSFQQDPARILRGVRLAARAGLQLDPATEAAMEAHAAAIAQLPPGRLQMELASLLGYGAAGASLALMWRLGLLDLLLPRQALYLRRHRVPRAPRSTSPSAAAAAAAAAATATTAAAAAGGQGQGRPHKRSLLLELASELDKHVHPQKPVDPAVWMALLAAPLVADACTTRLSRHARRQRRRGKQAPAADSSSDSSSSSSSSDEEGQAAAESDSTEAEDEAGERGLARSAASGHAHGSPAERAQRERYLAQYREVVDEVLDGMLQALEEGDLKSLGRTAKKLSEQLATGGSGDGTGKQRRVRRPQQPVLLPCVLSRAAAERAAGLLVLEADLRSHPELQSLLHNSGWSSGAGSERHGSPADQPQPQQQQMGRHHHEQRSLWGRLERAAEQTSLSGAAAAWAAGGGKQGEASPAPAGHQQQGQPPARQQQRRHRQGRVLTTDERLVLGILSDPRFQFASLTALPEA